jgi:hypothetical protein
MNDSKTGGWPLRDALEQALSDHYFDANWPRQHHGSRCGCGWLGEDHVGHLADMLMPLLGGVRS